MPHYLLTIYQPDGPPPPPEVLGPIMADLAQVNADLRAAGGYVFAAGLTTGATPHVLRLADGQVQTTDGPFVEAKEHVGGFTIIMAADLEAALAWGARFAKAITLPIEVRSLQDHG